MPRAATRFVAALFLALAACHDAAPEHASRTSLSLRELRALETSARVVTRFDSLPPFSERSGSDPFRIAALPGAGRFVATLRGASEIVLLDEALAVRARVSAPAAPTGLDVGEDGTIAVTGEREREIWLYRASGDALSLVQRIAVPSALSLRDVTRSPEGMFHAVDKERGHLITLSPDGSALLDERVCEAPIGVARTRSTLIVTCLLDHALVVAPIDTRGVPVLGGALRIEHDAPLFSASAVEEGGAVWIAAGGLEDRPLDRRGGSFGYIDSFLFLHRVAVDGGALRAERKLAHNLSADGVITPKWVGLSRRGEAFEVLAAGYGGDRLARLTLDDEGRLLHEETRACPPGLTDVARGHDASTLLAADPLLDGVVRVRAGRYDVTPLDPAPSLDDDARLGEALVFTHLLAPTQRSDGELSRFTCEACHFEGTLDGRVHHTGRGDVRASTRPLRGLFNNKPHFTRALDEDLTEMAHNEVRVANARTDRDPLAPLPLDELGWVRHLGVAEAELSPERIRRAMVAFFMAFTHEPNPRALRRARFTTLEAEGAERFDARCASCHAARLVTDDPASAVPLERWEALVLSREGPLVWASDGYRQTGVLPYVHERGARASSLRRIASKRPYFTNGSARTLEEVLDRAGWAGERFFHDGVPEGASRLSDDDKRALLSFLELL